MKGRTFDGEEGLHNNIDPSSSEAINDDGLHLGCEHKIFLSYSKAQRIFVDHLCHALEEIFLYPFHDNRRASLPKGENFRDLICKAAQQCQLFVVVLSEEYLMSKWPMMELIAFVKSMKEMKSSKKKGILPLFFGLSLSELMDERRKQRWFREWETRAKYDPKGLIKVDDWKYALDELSKYNGLSYDPKFKQIIEYENEIVSRICKIMILDYMWDDSHVQGNAHEVVIEKMKQIGASKLAKVKVVGLYGVGGIGKTTTCKILCNKLSSDFDGRVCHIEFESASPNSKELLQKVLIHLTKRSVKFVQQLDEEECKDVLNRNLRKEKTFLAIDNVLDNANSIEQAFVYLQTPTHPDSLILVTTRAQRTLELLEIDGATCLEMPNLRVRDAKNLFLHYAANGQHFTSDINWSSIDLYTERCCFSNGGGLPYYHPFALEVLGKELGRLGKNPSEWAQILSSEPSFNACLQEVEDFYGLSRSIYAPRPFETFKSQQALLEISDSASCMNAKAQGMVDAEDLPVFGLSDQEEEPQLRFPDSVTASMIVTSVSPAAPVSDRDPHGDISIDNNSTAVMAEPSSRLSVGRETPMLSPSIPTVEGDMPSTSFGKGPSNSLEEPTTDPLVYSMDELRPYLDIAAQCLVRVQEMPSRKINHEQCGYLDAKLKATLQSANLFLVYASCSSSEDMTRCIEVFKLLLAIALKIESFIEGCCKNEWLQAAMTLTNTTEYVSSLGFNLELCRLCFHTRWIGTDALTTAQVDNIDREEMEIVKRKSSVDVDVLLDKVISVLPSLQGEDKDLGIYLLQRLKRVKPISTSLSPESPFWSTFEDLSFLGRIFQLVQQSEQLGKGASATVHKAVWLGTPVARKTFDGPQHPEYLKEVEILGGLCHPNVMSMFCCAMDKRKCSFVMELMDEDLHSFMGKRLEASPHSPPFSVFEAVDVILQISEGVHYLHQNDIVHRDLKSFNILVKNILPPNLEFQYVLIKVADFGFAKIKESSTRYSNQTLNIGTNRWMPPEVINLRSTDGQVSTSMLPGGPKYPKKSDVYSFGMVCYEVLTGDVPFPQEASLINIKKKVLKGERPRLPDYCPSILKALIEACWDPEPSHRPSFASICSSLKRLKCLLMSV